MCVYRPSSACYHTVYSAIACVDHGQGAIRAFRRREVGRVEWVSRFFGTTDSMKVRRSTFPCVIALRRLFLGWLKVVIRRARTSVAVGIDVCPYLLHIQNKV